MRLGMCLDKCSDEDIFLNYLDDLKRNKFEFLHLALYAYTSVANVNITKSNALAAISQGFRVIWGVSGLNLTAANWADYEAAVLDAAAWAEANGVHEFSIGNELELNHDETLTDANIRDNLKILATAVQLVYTRGDVSYSCADSGTPYWITEGKGDIDLLAMNVYQGGLTFSNTWKTYVDNLIVAFGVNCYISEFSLSYTSLDTYSTNETTQASAIESMINYILNAGYNFPYFFIYTGESLVGNKWGIRKDNGDYRKEIWDILLKANGTFLGSAGTKEIRGLSHG